MVQNNINPRFQFNSDRKTSISSIIDNIHSKIEIHIHVDDLVGSDAGIKVTGGPKIDGKKMLWWDKYHSSILIEDILAYSNYPPYLYLYYYWDKKEVINIMPVEHKEYDELVVFLGNLVHKIVEKVGMTTLKRKKLITHMISQKMSQMKEGNDKTTVKSHE